MIKDRARGRASRTSKDEGDQQESKKRRKEGPGFSRTLPTYAIRTSPKRLQGSPSSCSRPRNNVSGLWFFIRARSHNGESVGSRSDPPVRSAGPMLFSRGRNDGEDGGEGRRRKARRRRARRRGGFCSHLESATRRGLPLFHVSPLPFRAPFLLPFLSLSLCFTFFPCADPLVSPFRNFLVSTCLSFFLPLFLHPDASSSTVDALCLSGKRD